MGQPYNPLSGVGPVLHKAKHGPRPVGAHRRPRSGRAAAPVHRLSWRAEQPPATTVRRPSGSSFWAPWSPLRAPPHAARRLRHSGRVGEAGGAIEARPGQSKRHSIALFLQGERAGGCSGRSISGRFRRPQPDQDRQKGQKHGPRGRPGTSGGRLLHYGALFPAKHGRSGRSRRMRGRRTRRNAPGSPRSRATSRSRRVFAPPRQYTQIEALVVSYPTRVGAPTGSGCELSTRRR